MRVASLGRSGTSAALLARARHSPAEGSIPAPVPEQADGTFRHFYPGSRSHHFTQKSQLSQLHSFALGSRSHLVQPSTWSSQSSQSSQSSEPHSPKSGSRSHHQVQENRVPQQLPCAVEYACSCSHLVQKRTLPSQLHPLDPGFCSHLVQKGTPPLQQHQQPLIGTMAAAARLLVGTAGVCTPGGVGSSCHTRGHSSTIVGARCCSFIDSSRRSMSSGSSSSGRSSSSSRSRCSMSRSTGAGASCHYGSTCACIGYSSSPLTMARGSAGWQLQLAGNCGAGAGAKWTRVAPFSTSPPAPLPPVLLFRAARPGGGSTVAPLPPFPVLSALQADGNFDAFEGLDAGPDMELPEDAMWHEGEKDPARQRRFIVVDGTAVVYRAYYKVFARLKRGQLGEVEFADKEAECLTVIAALSEIIKVLELLPSHFAVCFDADGRTFRHEMYRPYKAERNPRPPEVVEAVVRLRPLLDLLGVAHFSVAGVEADDVIATLATRAQAQGMKVRIVSPDKDFFQLLSPGLRLLRASSRGSEVTSFGMEEFGKKFKGLLPPQHVDVLALMGVRGVGEKRALELVQEFGSVENVMANHASVKWKSVREALLREVDDLPTYKRLVALKCNLPAFMLPDFSWDHLRVTTPLEEDEASLWVLLEALERNGVTSGRLKYQIEDMWVAYGQVRSSRVSRSFS